MTRRTTRFVIGVPLAVVAALALFAGLGLLAAGCGSSGATSSSSGGSSRDSAVAEAPAGQTLGDSGGAASKSASGGTSGTDYAAAIPPASPPSAHYLLRTGDLSLLVARGTLLSAVDRIKATTTAMNGYVMTSSIGSQSSQPIPLDTPVGSAAAAEAQTGATDGLSSSAAQPYASIVVRVPEQQFDAALKRFSELGDVQSATTSSDDVTSQYVDLQARLRHYRAVETRLLGFLQQTGTINQMLAVQDRVDKVQLTIEELTAQLKSLSETTTYGTISVYVTEKDRPVAAVHNSNTFGGTLSNSITLLQRGIRFAGLLLTALAPFIVVFGAVGVLVWFVVRRARRSRRASAPPAQAA